MDLTPGERAVLRQVADLFAATSRRDHALTTLTTQWPPIHYEAYRTALAALLGKKLLQASGDTQAVKLTDAGMRATGLVDSALDSSTQTIDLKVFAKGKPRSPRKPSPAQRSSRETTYHGPAEKTPISAAGRFGLLAIVACAGWVLWRFF